VACIGQPPPPSAPGPVWGWRAWLSSRGCGGWVRVLASAEQVRKERAGMEQAAKAGLVKIHGTHRGVLLVEFLDVPWS